MYKKSKYVLFAKAKLKWCQNAPPQGQHRLSECLWWETDFPLESPGSPLLPPWGLKLTDALVNAWGKTTYENDKQRLTRSISTNQGYSSI